MKRAPHIKMTEREFKRRKRKEFKELRAALDKFCLGCAYLPRDASQIMMIGCVETSFRQAHPFLTKWWRKA